MAEKILKSIKFPGLDDVYKIPGAEASIQPDYNQNDSTAADYIKNRPFYTGDLVETELVDVNAFLVESGESWEKESEETVDDINYLYNATLAAPLKEGQEYSVVFNGTKYVSVATAGNMTGMAFIGLGDVDAMMSGDMNNFAYVVVYIPEWNLTGITYKGAEAPTECKIYLRERELVKLDPKYLPEGGVGYVTTEAGFETFDIVKITNDLLESDNGHGGLDAMPPEEAPTEALWINGYLETYELPLPFKLVVGQEYKVSINNISYTSTAVARTERIEEDGEVFEIDCVGIGDIDEAFSENFADLRFVILYEELDGGVALTTMIKAEAFDLTEVPAEINISCPGQVEVIHKIDRKFLSQISSDWNENNPDADGYIKNRPFYVEASPNAVIENIIRTCASGDGNCFHWGFDEILPDFNIGSQYLVILDGVEYKCTCFKDSDTEATILGNFGVLDGNEGTGEPFFIYKFDDEDYGIYTRELQEVLSIYELLEEVHKIDSKFLPDDIGSNADWNQNDESASNYIKNRPFYEELVAKEVIFDEDCYIQPGTQISDSMVFTEGETYFVTFDDVMYQCVAWSVAIDVQDYTIYLGNGATIGIDDKDNGEPFLLESSASYGCNLYVPEEMGFSLKIETTETVVHKIDSKFLPDDIGSNGAANVQSDWNQNDKTALDYIKNRPFGNCLIETELVPEETFTITDGYTQISDSLTFIKGKTYKVVFNGEQYKCVAWYSGNDDAIIIGNGNIYGGDGKGEDVPFSCDSYSNGNCYLNVSDDGDYTIRIAELDNEITKIDKKYLQDTSWNELTDKPFEYEEKFEWDSEVEYEEIITDEEYGYSMIKISSNIPSDKEKFVGGRFYAVSDGEYFEVVMNESYIESFPDSDDVYYVAQNFMVVESDETSLDGLTITKGVWFFPYTDEPCTKIGIATAPKKIDLSVLHDPYYYEKGDLIFEDQVTTKKSSENKFSIECTLDESLYLKPDTNYVVELDGTEYLCKSTSMLVDNNYLGNSFLAFARNYADRESISLEQAEQFVSTMFNNMFKDTGEPFCITNNKYYTYIETKIAGTYQIKIYECATKKLNEAYLPDMPNLTEDLYYGSTSVRYSWNRDETYKTVIKLSEDDISLEFVKISDDYLIEDFSNKIMYITFSDGKTITRLMRPEDFVDRGGYYTYKETELLALVSEPSVDLFDDVTLTRGLWVFNINMNGYSSMNSLLIADRSIVLDEYTIPGTIARVKHTVSTPKTAQVGQTLVVKTVDAYDRPTSWECVGLPVKGSKYGKLVVFGDSLGEGANNDNYSFVDVLSESGMFSSVVKACKSSATIGPYSGEYAVGYDLNSQIERYASDVAGADIILCEYQFNDIFAVANGDIKIGQKDDADTETTICGYARKALKRIRELNPTAHITWLPSVVSDFNLIPFETNVKDGIHLFEMTVLSMAKEFGVGFISIMEEMSNESLMSSDGGHPNTLGHKRIAQVILHNLYGNSDIPRQERLLILSGDYNNQSTLAINGDPSIIAQLMRAGVDVRLAWDSGTGGIIFNAVFADNRAIIFRADGGTHGGFTVTWGMDGNINFIQENSICLPPVSLPPVTAEDEGKILMVVGGVPTWVSLPSAEEASF